MPEPEPIDFGNEACHHCKMTIVDPRYGAELVTKKGKVYKYDAVECLINSVYMDKIAEPENIHSLWVINFSSPGNLQKAEGCFFLHSRQLSSPMGMFLTAFGTKSSAEKARADYGGEIWNWEETISFVTDSAHARIN